MSNICITQCLQQEILQATGRTTGTRCHKKNFGTRTSSTCIWSLLSAFQLPVSIGQEGHLAELSAHVSGALGAEGGATSMAPPVAGSRELLETVLAEAPQMLPFEDRAWEAER